MSWEERFNRSGLSRFLNRPTGRGFRLAAGTAFLVVGYLGRHHVLGLAAMIWGVFPLSAGLFDVCYISVALGGPFSGGVIRGRYHA